ncbi:MAG: DNA-directed RNA polymerase subunit omega [Thermoanaerobaculia bacterium]
MQNIPERIDSRFRYILLAAERAEQIMRGAPAKVEVDSPKLTRVALEEVRRDLIDWDYGPAPEEGGETDEAAEG